jgi:hypothetical protein
LALTALGGLALTVRGRRNRERRPNTAP